MNKVFGRHQSINAKRRYTNSLTKPIAVYLDESGIYNRAYFKCTKVAKILDMTPQEVISDEVSFLENKMISHTAHIKMMQIFFEGPLKEFEYLIGRIILQENGNVIYEMFDRSEAVCFRLKRSKSGMSILISYRTFTEDEKDGGYKFSPYNAIPIKKGSGGVYDYLDSLGDKYNNNLVQAYLRKLQ